MVVLEWWLVWREFVCRWRQGKDEDEFCKVALPAARSDSGLSVSFFGGLPEGKLLIGLSGSRALWDWGMYFPFRSIRLPHLAKEYEV